MNPLHHFEVHPLIPIHIAGYDLSFTNVSLWMLITLGIILIIFLLITRSMKTIPGRWQSLVECAYVFVQKMLNDLVGIGGAPFFPYIFSLFIFIIFGNLIGLIPGSFTFTSQITITFLISFLSFLILNVAGIMKNRGAFFSLFFPQGLPLYLQIFLCPIELLSYLFRPLSLSIRLCANMIAGHIMLNLFISFCSLLSGAGMFSIFSLIPLFASSGLLVFESFICILQAYVFTMLTCIYLRDALHLH